MDDLISRQEAIDAMEQAKKQYFDRVVIIGKMQDIVNNLPSAQPDLDEVYAHAETEAEARFYDEIVRCKNCEYNSNTCGNYVNCDIIPQMFGRTADNFCSRAERRTDGTCID